MITDLNKILVEWAYRTNDGQPDVKSNAKLLTLEGVLKDFGWSREARAELLNTLMEIAPTTMVSNPNPKGRADKVQYQYAKQWMDDNPDAETSDDFKKDVGQEKDKPKGEPTQKKDLKKGIDFSGKNTPESITKEGTPTDDEFEEKKRSGKIKEQEYENDTIEVNGVTYKQPLSESDIKDIFKSPPHKIPERYIKVLNRILNTQRQGKSDPPITEFLDGVGAGEIPAQSAELC